MYRSAGIAPSRCAYRPATPLPTALAVLASSTFSSQATRSREQRQLVVAPEHRAARDLLFDDLRVQFVGAFLDPLHRS